MNRRRFIASLVGLVAVALAPKPIKTVPSTPKLGLLDGNHTPAGTSMGDWTIAGYDAASHDPHTTGVITAAHDIEGWVEWTWIRSDGSPLFKREYRDVRFVYEGWNRRDDLKALYPA